MIKAHTKFDPATGDWLLAGLSYGRTMQIHAITHGADGRLKSHQIIESPRQIYLHDFLATEKHFIFVLQPMMFTPWMMLAGFSSFIECLSWKREAGQHRDGSAARRRQASLLRRARCLHVARAQRL